MFSMGVPKSLASITAAAPGASFSMSWPKNGPPKRPICRRGSGSLVRAIITNARPVMGPSCAEAGKEISKRGPAVCALAVVGIQNMPTAANRISAVRLNWIIVVSPQKDVAPKLPVSQCASRILRCVSHRHNRFVVQLARSNSRYRDGEAWLPGRIPRA